MKKNKTLACIILMALLAQLFMPIVLADTDVEINFLDDDVRQSIISICDENKDGKVTKSEIEKLTNIYLSGRNFEGMQYAINLEKISINYSYSDSDLEYDLSALAKLPKLKSIYISGSSSQRYSDFAGIANISSLEEITLQSLQILQGDFDGLAKLPNLKNVKLWLDSSSGYERKMEISEVSKLTNIEELEIRNLSNVKLDANSLKSLSKLKKLYLNDVDVTNEDAIANCTNLQNVTITGGKISSIKFVQSLKKLNTIDCSSNFITDLTPLKGTSAYTIKLENNPIDTSKENNKQVINSVQNIKLSDYSKMKNLEFKNKEFEKALLQQNDLNRDGKISIYEMNQISYISYTSGLLENIEYLTSLKQIRIDKIQGRSSEQMNLIAQVNSMNLNSININTVVAESETVCSNSTYRCSLSEMFPILSEIKKSGSIFEIKNPKITEIVNYESAGEVKDDFIELSIDTVGLKKKKFHISGDNKSMDIEFNLTVMNVGDDTKEVYFEDANLKNEVLKKCDFNNDGKVTQNELLSLDDLNIADKNIHSLKGLENATGIENLNAYNNHIKDISPIIGIVKKDARYFLNNNEITDVTPLLNNKTDISMWISLDENYIDFADESENLKAIKYNYAKEEDIESSSLINTIICGQRYGKPEDKTKVVNLDSNIKKELIGLGIDTNGDGNLTREELYNAKNNYFSIDLSGLGANSVSGLEYLRCYELDISNNNITDITPIAKNKLFNNVNFSHNKIKDISSLVKNNNYFWNTVDFSYNQIENISSISNWPVMKYDAWRELFAGDGNIREIKIDLSNNNIKDISAVKNWRHIGKLDLSNNKITNISALSNYDFKCYNYDDGKYEECLDEFDGIILKNNKIDATREDNKKAIDLFKSKGVTLDVTNQDVQRFDDVAKNEWYYNAVKYVYEHKVMSGLNASTFAPDQKLTRGMIVTMLHNMEGHPSVTGTSKFFDVQNKNVYFYNAVVWASNNNVVNGYENGKFGADDNITREQLATILYNYCRYKGKYKTVHADYSKFTDSSKISSFAKWGMNWAVGNKIVNGSNGKLNPQGTATRAEAAAMISNYCNTIK